MISSFMVIYFLQLGFSYFEISVILAAYGMAMFLFEIPTGAFADGLSRKYSVVVGSVIYGLMVMFIPFTTSYYAVAVLWACAGIGMTFISGAEEAWVISNLNYAGRKDLHHEFFIKNNSIGPFGSIFSPLAGAVLVKFYSIKILWFILGGGFLMGAVILVFFSWERFEVTSFHPLRLIETSYRNCRKGVSFALTHEKLLYIILGGVFLQLMFFANIGIAPFLVDNGIQEYQLGYLSAVVAVVCILMSFLSRIYSGVVFKNVMTGITVVLIVLYILLGIVNASYLIVVLFLLISIEGINHIGLPLAQTYFHKFIPENIRSTVVSVKSMADQLIIALSTLLAGYSIDLFGIQKVFIGASVFGLVAIYFYRKIKD